MVKAEESPVRWFRRRVIAKTQSPPREAFAVPSAPSTRLLILQPTPFCNLDCDYCYLPNRDDTRRMSIATVRVSCTSITTRRSSSPQSRAT